MPHSVHVLSAADRCALHQHFAQLTAQDLQLRFGRTPDAAWLALVVDGFDFARDTVLGVRDGDQLAGVAHLALFDGAAELGISVTPPYRRRGMATALFIRAALRARDHGVTNLYIRDLARNRSMCRIARQAGMCIREDARRGDAWIELPALLDQLLSEAPPARELWRHLSAPALPVRYAMGCATR